MTPSPGPRPKSQCQIFGRTETDGTGVDTFCVCVKVVSFAFRHSLFFLLGRRWDEDGSGELEFEEVVRAFAKSFNIDVAGISQLRESLQAVWCVFDTDGSGAIDRQEFMAPNGGLADTVLATIRYM